ncbi:MAG: hypothetical protein IT350_09980 [Deltaproteobacteria bacterium]|nr:hypothetical protein [Deltaproteobacteria bacterium]
MTDGPGSFGTNPGGSATSLGGSATSLGGSATSAAQRTGANAKNEPAPPAPIAAAPDPDAPREPELVPSRYKGPDPEFDRPIFKRHKDTPPAGPTGTIIRKAPPPPPARPQIPRPEMKSETRAEARIERPAPAPRQVREPLPPRPIARTEPRPEPRTVPRVESRAESRTEPRSEPSRVARMPLAPVPPLPLKKVETGIMALDHRIGGLSVGTMNVLSGVEHSARSYLAVHIANTVIENGGRVLALISPTEEGYWAPTPGLYVDVAVRRDPDDLIATIESAGKVDLVIFDPLHAVQTPPEQDRIAAVDHAVAAVAKILPRLRTTVLAVSHMVDRAARHQGVSLHPWMFRDVAVLLDASEVILILRTSRTGGREILIYRRGINNRVGGLPSFVLPWV